jgi:hypothetical protein
VTSRKPPTQALQRGVLDTPARQANGETETKTTIVRTVASASDDTNLPRSADTCEPSIVEPVPKFNSNQTGDRTLGSLSQKTSANDNLGAMRVTRSADIRIRPDVTLDGEQNVSVRNVSTNVTINDDSREQSLCQNAEVVDNEFRRLAGAFSGDEITNENVTRTEFMNEQQSDSSLTKFRRNAEDNHPDFFMKNGLLYRRAANDRSATDGKLLVVPDHYRRDVLQTAHDAMFSGAHNGAYRMTQRIKAAGLWFENMFEHCKQWQRSCDECQKLAIIRKSHRVPMVETPIIGEVFAELSIDVCGGDWPITPRRNKYLLTVQCTASRYAWAIPVTNLKAKTLAAKLMHLFASIGLPKVLKFDAAAQWRGSLMTELTRLLGITCNIATPFHHQSIGGVERLNQTIERMAKNYILENPRAWDIYVDYLMFAYNSVLHWACLLIC